MAVNAVLTWTMPNRATRWPRVAALYGAGIGFGCGIVVTIASAMADAANGLIVPILAVAVVSSMTTVVGALATAVQMWLLYAGFVISHAGEVALNHTSATAAAILVGTAMGATAAGAVIRWMPQPRTVRVPAPRQHFASTT